MGHRPARPQHRPDRLLPPARGRDGLSLLEARRDHGRVVAPGSHGNCRPRASITRPLPVPKGRKTMTLAAPKHEARDEQEQQDACDAETDDPEKAPGPGSVLPLIL